MINKKGNIIGIILMVGILFIILFLGFIIAIGVMTLDFVADEVVPELKAVGVVGETNFTEITEMAIDPVDNIIQSFVWMGGLLYIISLLLCFGIAYAFRFTGSKWLITFFILCMLILVIASIFISNMYEEFYNDSGEVGTRLKEQTLLSYLILYSPLIICVVGFVCGVIMFTGNQEESFV